MVELRYESPQGEEVSGLAGPAGLFAWHPCPTWCISLSMVATPPLPPHPEAPSLTRTPAFPPPFPPHTYAHKHPPPPLQGYPGNLYIFVTYSLALDRNELTCSITATTDEETPGKCCNRLPATSYGLGLWAC